MSNMQTVVNTKSGKVEGYYEDNLYVFRGIPYAEPPVGELRWMPPQPVKSWDGVRPAKEFGPIAPQNAMIGGPIVQVEQPKDEDCLFLNIWTPGPDDKKRPVMVWIHGGAFTIGSGSDPMYDNGSLADRGDIVLVTINYRLGMLGFLNLREVTGGRIPATGNEGLLDQVAALKWVKENIAAFGGDPGNVTIFGESAGGMSIGCLLAMPAAKGYFHKAILESGVGSTAGPLDQATNVARDFLKLIGIKSDDVEALRSLTVPQLLEVEMKLRVGAAGPGEASKITVTTPVIDGEVIPDIPTIVVREGAVRDVPLLLGSNLEEWKLFAIMQPGFDKIDDSEAENRLKDYIPAEHVSGLIETYRSAREKRGESASPADILSAIETDLMFRMPVLQLVEAQRVNNPSVYNYLFTWKSPVMGGVLGACHALEIGFVFGAYNDMFCGTGPDADKLSECIQEAWIAFARNGDPSCQAIGKWPAYGDRRMTMMLDKDCHVEEAPYEEERRAWDIMPNIYNVVL